MKTLFAEVRRRNTGVLQPGVVPQRLAVGIEQLAEFGLAGRRFAEQTAVADLLDVTGLQVDLDREAVFQLVELVRVQRCARVVLGERLLRGEMIQALPSPRRLRFLAKPSG